MKINLTVDGFEVSEETLREMANGPALARAVREYYRQLHWFWDEEHPFTTPHEAIDRLHTLLLDCLEDEGIDRMLT